jgi:hypothetical protein
MPSVISEVVTVAENAVKLAEKYGPEAIETIPDAIALYQDVRAAIRTYKTDIASGKGAKISAEAAFATAGFAALDQIKIIVEKDLGVPIDPQFLVDIDAVEAMVKRIITHAQKPALAGTPAPVAGR